METAGIILTSPDRCHVCSFHSKAWPLKETESYFRQRKAPRGPDQVESQHELSESLSWELTDTLLP
jgi:hypothetical protein